MKCSRPTTRAPGFTLTELIVVIAMIAATLAVSYPMLGAMRDLTEDRSGLNTIQVGVTAARAYATRDIAALSTISADASYSGTALLFTPQGELRLLENTQIAVSTGGNPLEDSLQLYRNGYQDIPDRDYLILPRDVGVVGIARESSGNPTFHAPPFAVRFNEKGHLIASENASKSKLVYYDGNGDGRFRISSGAGWNRSAPYGGGTYDMDLWDPTSPQFAAPVQDQPFEEIESVVGILVYSKRQFRADGADWPGSGATLSGCGIGGGAPCTSLTEWLQYNGTAYFFSRYTGVLLREMSE